MLKINSFIGFLLLFSVSLLARQQHGLTAPDVRNAEIIAYSITSPGGTANIFFINSDGSGNTQITNQSGRLYGAAFSPDASKIALYNHISDRVWSLYLMDVNGTNLQRLTNALDTLDWSPDWSPDGSMIVFVRSFPSPVWRSELWIINV